MLVTGLFTDVGTSIQLPPVMNFGSKKIQEEVIPEVLAGRKWISLAVRLLALQRCLPSQKGVYSHKTINRSQD